MIEPVFNSFFMPWGTNIISLIVFPLLGADLTSRIPESLTEFICVVVTHPILISLVHRFIGCEYLQVEERLMHTHFTLLLLKLLLPSFIWLNEFMPASIWPVWLM